MDAGEDSEVYALLGNTGVLQSCSPHKGGFKMVLEVFQSWSYMIGS